MYSCNACSFSRTVFANSPFHTPTSAPRLKPSSFHKPAHVAALSALPNTFFFQRSESRIRSTCARGFVRRIRAVLGLFNRVLGVHPVQKCSELYFFSLSLLIGKNPSVRRQISAEMRNNQQRERRGQRNHPVRTTNTKQSHHLEPFLAAILESCGLLQKKMINAEIHKDFQKVAILRIHLSISRNTISKFRHCRLKEAVLLESRRQPALQRCFQRVAQPSVRTDEPPEKRRGAWRRPQETPASNPAKDGKIIFGNIFIGRQF